MMMRFLPVPRLPADVAWAVALVSAVALGTPTLALTQSYPSRPITMIVPFPAGGVAALPARLVAERLSASLAQTIVVDNRPGAGGTIGAKAAAGAAPDGYTLLFGGTSTLSIAPAINSTLAYDVLKSFAPVAMVATLPFVIVVNPNVPARTVQELVTYVRAN